MPEFLPVWVESHAPKRKINRYTWTHEEWGNHLADRLADGDLDDMAAEVIQHVVLTVSSHAMIKGILIRGEWYWGDINRQPTALSGLMTRIHRHRYGQHLADR